MKNVEIIGLVRESIGYIVLSTLGSLLAFIMGKRWTMKSGFARTLS